MMRAADLNLERADCALQHRPAHRTALPWSVTVATQAPAMNTLMILTSHHQLGNTGKKAGSWLEEFAAPRSDFKDVYPDRQGHRGRRFLEQRRACRLGAHSPGLAGAPA
jgi:hypothetical protein